MHLFRQEVEVHALILAGSICSFVCHVSTLNLFIEVQDIWINVYKNYMTSGFWNWAKNHFQLSLLYAQSFFFLIYHVCCRAILMSPNYSDW